VLLVIDLSLFIARFTRVHNLLTWQIMNTLEFPNKLMFAYNLHGTTIAAATASLELTVSSLLLPISKFICLYTHIHNRHEGWLRIMLSAAFGLKFNHFADYVSNR
jgi:hypothetical protein